jgi:hypothetical protein
MPQTDQTADAAKRATRTGAQSAISVGLLLSGWNLFAPPAYRLNNEQLAWLTIVGTAAPTIVSFIWNVIEEASGHSFLKSAPVEDETADFIPNAMLHEEQIAMAQQINLLKDLLIAQRADQRPIEPEDPALILPRALAAELEQR